MTFQHRAFVRFLARSCAVGILAAGPTKVHPDWMVTGFTGRMTDDVWEEAILVVGAEFLDSGLIGVGIGREFAEYGRLSLGFEIQAVQHFGTQDNFEINAPLTLRYNRRGDFLPALVSLAFGFGVSWASEVPQTEINRDGASAQTMFYWMGELQFDLPNTDIDLVTRIHHRSDGYGVWSVDSGSNALVIGLRKSF